MEITEGSINFKALRAKFQEEGLLAHSKISRPAVAEKPKLLQPFLGHCSSVASCIATAVEDHTPEIPRVFFRDGVRSSGGKRPISFPPRSKQTSPSFQLANGDGSAKHHLKDWHMPLVLPVPPAETRKEVFSHTKIKKKGLLLPFKSVKASKNFAGNGEELTYGDLPNRPGDAPSDFSSMDKQGSEERPSLQSDQSTSENAISSPEFVVSPPSPETCPDSDNRILSTLEKAKKKLSRRQIAIPPKTKGLRSPDYSCIEKTFRLSPKNPDRLGSDVLVPPSSSLPHLACISARPFCKANNSHLMLEKASQPLKKLLPELWTLGPVPVKPPRPSTVDLSSYHAVLAKGKVSVLDVPDFPDFETSELEKAEAEPVDIAALEMEAVDIVVGNPATPAVSEATDYGGSDSALAVCEPRESNRINIVQDLNLGTLHIIPLDPASFPEPINPLEFPQLPQCTSPYTADHKEQRKREKQRLEKEKKEQKEREKKENEMKKKFKVTGEEEPMYHAKVMVASKVRKNDLPVRNGDTVSIIRTTNCPKGKWLARDANLKYGYISVMNVELNIKDMLELGKKAQAAGRGAYVEPDTISIGSRYLEKKDNWISLFCFIRSKLHASLRICFFTPNLYLKHFSLFLIFCDSEQEIDFTEMELLPPPPLYADTL
uniref:Si:ch211-188c16.1 n=1 Tax=Xiphophorus maculatus TaxID=8083 RepID=A0A3B5QGQ8_XIPMA